MLAWYGSCVYKAETTCQLADHEPPTVCRVTYTWQWRAAFIIQHAHNGRHAWVGSAARHAGLCDGLMLVLQTHNGPCSCRQVHCHPSRLLPPPPSTHAPRTARVQGSALWWYKTQDTKTTSHPLDEIGIDKADEGIKEVNSCFLVF